MKDIPQHMKRSAYPTTPSYLTTGGIGMTKLEYAAVHIAAGIRAAESTVVSEGKSMTSVDLARMALDDATAVLGLADLASSGGY